MAEVFILGVTCFLILSVVASRPRHRRHRHSFLYRHYIDNSSLLWRTRRRLWYYTSNRRCEKCGCRLVLHPTWVSSRIGAQTMSTHHKHYRNLGHERRGRDIELLCPPCHMRTDAWRHR